MKRINVKAAVATAGKLVGSSCPAAPVPGEMTFTKALTASGAVLPGVEAGPVKYLLGGVGRIFKGIPGVLKDRKRIIPVLIISLLWLVLLLLPAVGVRNPVLGWLSFLTFARGGTGGGLLGMVGGLVGKGLYAYFITSMIMSLFSGGKPFAGLNSGLKTLLGSFNIKDKLALCWLLMGAGAALIAYNFLTGNASLSNSMAGVAAFIISLKALSNNHGFLRGFIMSVLNKAGKGSSGGAPDITCIMAGWAAGFAIGIPLSVMGISAIGYITGIVLILAAAVIRNLKGGKKEEVTG